MRKKPNLIPRMERCAHVQIKEPTALRGKWMSENPGYTQLWLELGCGKGRFTAETAAQNPDALLVAVEKVADAMVVGMERVCDAEIKNVRFIDTDVANLPEIFLPQEVDRIFINFCDPWRKNRDAKHRLTSPLFLKLYENVLKPGGEIHFKTDNAPLFEYSVEQFLLNGWNLTQLTHNLHAAGVVGIMTDYEEKFHSQGVPINRLVAKKEVSHEADILER
ncbi:MAG: tRNA (guanosine(46)-N7)-methyltransferase TrmB [Oscillospiraceae bacterium]